MLLEDTWPTHWLTVYQSDNAGNVISKKCQQSDWAKTHLKRMILEAQELILSAPQLPIEEVGWRHDYYSPETAAYLCYDPTSPDEHYDPIGRNAYSSTALRKAWALLTHERTFRLMRSVGLLYKVTADEAYAEWVASGMLRAADFVETAERSGWERSAFGGKSIWYQPLYEATSLLALANAYALTRHSAAYAASDHDRIRKVIFEARIPRQMDFLRNIGELQNMAAYAAAAVAIAGEVYGRDDWLTFALGEEFGFVRWLESNVPDAPDGKPDGWWNEQTTFYHFYALAPLIVLYNLSSSISEQNIRRFYAMFEAPLKLAFPNLQLHLMGDLGTPGEYSLVDMRHFYEFAAGQLDSDRFGQVLASIYEQSGVDRGSIWAMLFGPADLPEPKPIICGHANLPVSGYGAFRSQSEGVTLGFRGGEFRGGHDHPDRLSIYMHTGECPIAVDLGEPGYALRELTEDYFRRTISHNTLFADECDNRGHADVQWDFDSCPSMARGVIADFEGVRYERTIIFDMPYIVLIDTYQSTSERRFGWVFHASGELQFLNTRASRAVVEQPPYGMPPIPQSGNGYGMITQRKAATVSESLRARWVLADGHKYLDATILSDGGFEATAAKSAGNPLPQERSALILRAPGRSRRFMTIFNLHSGHKGIEEVNVSGNRMEFIGSGGEMQIYQW